MTDTKQPPLYGRLANNGGRYHIADPDSLENYVWSTLCNYDFPNIAAVSEAEGIDFENSPFVNLCPKCKRRALAIGLLEA